MDILVRTFASAVAPAISLADEGNRNAAMKKMGVSVLPILDGIFRKTELLSLSVRGQSDFAWGESKRLAQNTLVSSGVLFFSIFLAGMGLALGLYRSVVHPLAKLREGAKKVSEGAWDLKIDVHDPPEMVEMAKSFEDMATSLKRLQVRITQLDRMSAMGTLAGGVAHEINNPLTGVLGQSQMILSKLELTDPLRSNVEKIERAAQKCKRIVRGLLDFSRSTDYLFQTFDVNIVIDHALGLVESEMILKNVQIQRINRVTPLPKIFASEHHLEQVFLNILLNAVAAMPEGGIFTILTDVDPAGVIPTAQVWNEGMKLEKEHVTVSFTDSGAGISQANIPKVFDPFFTTKDPGKGTGLGLSISYNIMKVHHGELTVSSAGAGKGSTFTVRIPISEEWKQSQATPATFETLEGRLNDFEKAVGDGHAWPLQQVQSLLQTLNSVGGTVKKGVIWNQNPLKDI